MIHPETGEVLETEAALREARAELEAEISRLYRLRWDLDAEIAVVAEPAEQPERRRLRTDVQEKVRRCPRCGGRLNDEPPSVPQSLDQTMKEV